MAGVGRMETRRYLTWSAVGAVLWVVVVTVLGAVLGRFEFVKNNIEIILILVVVLSLIPVVIEAVQARRQRRTTP